MTVFVVLSKVMHEEYVIDGVFASQKPAMERVGTLIDTTDVIDAYFEPCEVK